MKKQLKYRMYGLVPYNISEIQKGIQFGHAVVEYGILYDNPNDNLEYESWAINDKTFIILNGGTTNDDLVSEWFGSLNQHVITLQDNGINYATFNEPDLGNQLTAVVFLVDECVYNKTDYPDFYDYLSNKNFGMVITNALSNESLEEQHPYKYQEWVETVGGPKNVFLRTFLKYFKLA